MSFEEVVGSKQWKEAMVKEIEAIKRISHGSLHLYQMELHQLELNGFLKPNLMQKGK